MNCAELEALETRRLLASITVTNTNDAGAGSLREAIVTASAGDSIDLAVRGTITLITGELRLDRRITINGPGRNVLTISGNHVSRVFVIAPDVTASISSIQLSEGGGVADGGAMHVSGTAILSSVDFASNRATRRGGAIFSDEGTILINGCSFSDNLAGGAQTDASGGAIHAVGGAMFADESTWTGNAAAPISGGLSANAVGGAITLKGGAFGSFSNCTIDANHADAATRTDVTTFGGSSTGGAIAAYDAARLEFQSCTITRNRATRLLNGSAWGGGIDLGGRAAQASFHNTVIAENEASTAGPDIYGSHRASSAGHNVIGVGDRWNGVSAFADGVSGDIVGTESDRIDPILGPLQDNGGDTLTRMPLNGSPLVDKGDSTGAPARDQRFVNRLGTIDVGAVESPAPWFTTQPVKEMSFGAAYSYAIAASDSAGGVLSITAPDLPTWLSFEDHGDGTALLRGTPPDPIAGAHAVRLRANNGTYIVEQVFNVSVTLSTFQLSDTGILTVVGGVGPDNIQVWIRESQVRAVVNGEIRNFPLSSVAGVVVYGLDDHDVLSVNMRSMPAYVLGGGGNDTLNGGDENDTFIGGSGHDSLAGGAGDDRLSGLGGNDYLVGGSGNDYLTGGDGFDVLIGNAGNDRLYGDAGNDILYGKDGAYDILDGGLGDDQATYDSNDLLHDLFSTPA